MNRFIEPNLSKKYEEAVCYLTSNYQKSGHNPKPVVMHSLSIAFHLLELGYDEEIILAAILHDIVEDTDISLEEIKKKFGSKVTTMIKAVSYDENISNWQEKYLDMFNRTLKLGRKATILKATDIYYNSFYIKLVDDLEFQKTLIEKMHVFLEMSKKLIGDETPWKELQDQYYSELKRVNSKD